VASIKAEADRRAANVLPIIGEAQKAGATTLRQIAEALNARGVATARGGAVARNVSQQRALPGLSWYDKHAGHSRNIGCWVRGGGGSPRSPGSVRTGYSHIPFEGLWAAQGRVQKQARPQLSRSASEIILSALSPKPRN
jgi:hypothetical protein